MRDLPEADDGDRGVEKAGQQGRSKVVPVVVSLVLIAAVATSVVCAVFLIGASNDRLTLSRGLLEVLEGSPEEVIYLLRAQDPDGDILTEALCNVRNDNQDDFSDMIEAVSDKLMGDDQIAFFTTSNSYGVENSKILGYLAGCLRSSGAGKGDIPYPRTDDGEPYEGAQEILYDREMARVVGD